METNDFLQTNNGLVEPKKKASFFIRLFKMNPTAFILFVLIIIGSVFIFFKYNSIVKQNLKEKETIITKHKIELDSLKIVAVEKTVKVFSWAVRSELIRDNKDQINQFFLWFVKEPIIQTVSLIDPDSGTIILSSDKKLERQAANLKLISENDAVHTDTINGDLFITAPVYGLDKKIGVIAVKIDQ